MKGFKKVVVAVLSVITLAFGSLGLASCGILGLSQSSSVDFDSQGSVWTMETVYAEAQSLGYTGTLEEFRESIRGKDGANGKDSVDGEAGKDDTNGKDGVSVVGAEINADNELMFTFSNGETINAGKLTGSDCNCDLGAIGAGVKKIWFDPNNELHFTLTDGTDLNVGKIPPVSIFKVLG